MRGVEDCKLDPTFHKENMTNYKYIIVTQNQAGIALFGQLAIEVQKLTSEIELVEYEIVDMMIRDHGFDPRTHNIDIHELSSIKNLKGHNA